MKAIPSKISIKQNTGFCINIKYIFIFYIYYRYMCIDMCVTYICVCYLYISVYTYMWLCIYICMYNNVCVSIITLWSRYQIKASLGPQYKVTETLGGKQPSCNLLRRSWASAFLIAWRTENRIFVTFFPKWTV